MSLSKETNHRDRTYFARSLQRLE
ncbi:MAG: phosphate transport system regulatory protein PhoU, partial [Microcystis panniformis]